LNTIDITEAEISGGAQERSPAHPFELNPPARRNPEAFVPGTGVCTVVTDQCFGDACLGHAAGRVFSAFFDVCANIIYII